MMAAMASAFPRPFDTMAEATLFDAQKTDRPAASPADKRDNLYEAQEDGGDRSAREGHTRETSLYTEMQLRPSIPAMALAAASVAALSMLRPRGPRR